MDFFLVELLRWRSRASPPPEPDHFPWTALLERAARHQVLPLVLDPLLTVPDFRVPELEIERMRRLRQDIGLLAMMQDLELRRAAQRLAEHGIPSLVLKGPALGRLAYENPSLRSHGDIDLLVPEERYGPALEALSQSGFTLNDPDMSSRYHRPYHYHDILGGKAQVSLELHWGLSRPDDLFRLDPSVFFEHGVAGEAELSAALSSPTDLMLHSAAQSLADGFVRLVRVCDADRLLRRCGDRIDTDRLLEDARRGGLGPALWMLLRLARIILSTPVRDLDDHLHPGLITEMGIRSLDPEMSMIGGPAIDRTSLRHAYTFWLVVGPKRRLRALVRTVRLQTLQKALLGPGPTRLMRFRGFLGRLLMVSKLIVFQALSLAALPLRRRS